MKRASSSPRWVKTLVADLIRYVPSGTHCARAYVGGKLILTPLGTEKASAAQLRLTNLIEEEWRRLETPARELASMEGARSGAPAMRINKVEVTGERTYDLPTGGTVRPAAPLPLPGVLIQ